MLAAGWASGPTPASAQDLLDDLGGDEPEASDPAEEQPPSSEEDIDIDAPLDSVEDEEGASPEEGESEEGESEEGEAEEIEAAPAEAEAEEEEAAPEEQLEQDPSALDRVKAVPRKPILKKNRLEIAPLVSTSLNDAYYQHLTVGGALIFYPHDNFGIGLGAEYFVLNAETQNVEAVRENLTSVPAVFEHPKLFAHLDLYWVPFYGKISLFDDFIVHFDLYAAAGFGIATAFAGQTPPLANVAIGQRFVLSDWASFRVEVRDSVYLDTQEVNGKPRSDLQNFVMFGLGFSFFVPPSFEYSLL